MEAPQETALPASECQALRLFVSSINGWALGVDGLLAPRILPFARRAVSCGAISIPHRDVSFARVAIVGRVQSPR